MPLLLAGTAGCGDSAEPEERARDAPPAAAVVAPDASAQLDVQLEQLEAELTAALGDDLNDGGLDHLLRAEAITDRIMEAERTIDWLASAYDVEARVRQLQAMADRVIALLRRGVGRARVREEVDTLRLAVTELRAALARPGGGAAPPPLDTLLARAARNLPAPPPPPDPDTGADETPLGTPVAADTTGTR